MVILNSPMACWSSWTTLEAAKPPAPFVVMELRCSACPASIVFNS